MSADTPRRSSRFTWSRLAIAVCLPGVLCLTPKLAPAQILVSGSVVDHNAETVADADVYVVLTQGWGEPKTIAHSTTDTQGRFDIDLPDRNTTLTPMTVIGVVAVARQHGIAWRQIRGRLPGGRLTLKLPAARTARYRILAPDGKPAPGVTIAPDYFFVGPNESRRLPHDRLLDRLAAVTDADGVAVIHGVARESVRSVVTRSDRHGRQDLSLWKGDGVPEELRLLQSGSIEGRVTVPEGVDPSRIRINFGASPDSAPGERAVRRIGAASVTPGPDGRFTVKAIAAGKLRVAVRVPGSFPAVEERPEDLAITANATTQVTVPFTQGVQVTRRLIEQDSGRGIPRVELVIQGHGLERTVVTDKNGRFAAWLRPNAEYHTAFNIPHGYLHQNRNENRTVVGAEDTSLSDLQLLKARSITGKVLNADGSPAGNVRILGNWNDPDEDFGFAAVDAVTARISTTSDADGNYVLHSVHPGVIAQLTPLRDGVLVGDSVMVPRNTTRQDIKLAELNNIALTGRITNWPDAARGGGTCRLYATFSGERSGRSRRFVAQLEVAADGSFRTAATMPDLYAYQVRVLLNGADVAATRWLVPRDDKTNAFAPIAIPPDVMNRRDVARARQRFEMTRTVVDSAGRPVPNASVTAWYLARRQRLQTDKAGRFTLLGVPDKGAWVFIHAEGFRYVGGFVARQTAGPIRLHAATASPGGSPLRTRTHAQPDAELLATVMQQYEDAVTAMIAHREVHDYQRRRAAQALVTLHPPAASKLEGQPGVDPDALKWNTIRALAGHDFDAAMRRAIALPAERRLRMYYAMLSQETLSDDQQADVVARAIALVGDGVEDLSVWGGLLLDVGEREAAVAMFNKALKNVPDFDENERASFTRGLLAWNYAPLDPDTALKLIESETDNRNRIRFLTNIAHRLAATHPQRSIEVLEMLPAGSAQERAAFKVVATMGAADSIRARRLAYGLEDPRLRAHALATVAQANPKAKDARRLLEQAFRILEEETNAGDRTGRGIRTSLTTAVAILPIVEAVAPEQLHEYLNRALSLRRNIATGNESRALGPHGKGRTLRIADPILATALARYDTETARQVGLDVADETLDLPVQDAPYQVLTLLAILDPEQAVRKAKAMSGDSARDLRAKADAWFQIAKAMTATPEEHWAWVMERHYFLPDPRTVD